jgi:hypothetical protein
MSRLPFLLAAIAVVALASVGGGASAAESSRASFLAKPRLVLIDVMPLTVRGSSFKARERVTVSVDIGPTQRGALRLRATRQGGFVAAFRSVPLVRCHPLTIRALGVQGSRAVRQVQYGPDCRMP